MLNLENKNKKKFKHKKQIKIKFPEINRLISYQDLILIV